MEQQHNKLLNHDGALFDQIQISFAPFHNSMTSFTFLTLLSSIRQAISNYQSKSINPLKDQQGTHLMNVKTFISQTFSDFHQPEHILLQCFSPAQTKTLNSCLFHLIKVNLTQHACEESSLKSIILLNQKANACSQDQQESGLKLQFQSRSQVSVQDMLTDRLLQKIIKSFESIQNRYNQIQKILSQEQAKNLFFYSKINQQAENINPSLWMNWKTLKMQISRVHLQKIIQIAPTTHSIDCEIERDLKDDLEIQLFYFLEDLQGLTKEIIGLNLMGSCKKDQKLVVESNNILIKGIKLMSEQNENEDVASKTSQSNSIRSLLTEKIRSAQFQLDFGDHESDSPEDELRSKNNRTVHETKQSNSALREYSQKFNGAFNIKEGSSKISRIYSEKVLIKELHLEEYNMNKPVEKKAKKGEIGCSSRCEIY